LEFISHCNPLIRIHGRVFWESLNFLPLFPSGATAPSGPGLPQYRGFVITLGRTPLVEESAQ